MSLTYKTNVLEKMFDAAKNDEIAELFNTVSDLQEFLEAETNMYDENSDESRLFSLVNDQLQMLKNDNIVGAAH